MLRSSTNDTSPVSIVSSYIKAATDPSLYTSSTCLEITAYPESAKLAFLSSRLSSSGGGNFSYLLRENVSVTDYNGTNIYLTTDITADAQMNRLGLCAACVHAEFLLLPLFPEPSFKISSNASTFPTREDAYGGRILGA